MRIFTKSSIATAVSILALHGCGGGGGGGSPSPIVRPTYDVPFHTPTRVSTVQTLTTPVTDSQSAGPNNITDTFTADLSGAGAQNLIVAGRYVQPANSNTYINSQISIFGWTNGQLVNQTSQWFSGTDNIILGTEPSVKFGDFLGNGKIGMYVSPSTDTSTTGAGVVFINNGTSFTRVNLDTGNIWSHDSIVYDFNRDGRADIYATDYGWNSSLSISRGDGTFNTYRTDSSNSAWNGASSVAAGDFLGNNTTSLILTDTNTSKQDTKLFSWSIVNNKLSMTELGILPIGRFDLPRWASYNFGGGDPTTTKMSHNVRVLAFDFDNSGITSAVVFARPVLTNGQWPDFSEVQFLKNNGSGTFTDVTDTVLVGYNTATTVSYNPKLLDINGDGLTDIFLSSGYGTSAGTTRVLVHTQEHKYVDSYINVFSAFRDQAYNAELARSLWASTLASTVNIIQGPNNDLYLVTLIDTKDSTGTYQKAMYLSKIGAQTATAQATVNAIRQNWPYLSAAQANTILSTTSTTWFGLNIIDPEKALNPIGGLGFRPNQQFSGYLGGVNLNNINVPVYMFDSIGRNFAVNLAPTAPTNMLNPWARQIDNITDDTRGAQLMGMPMTSYNGLKFGGDSNTRTMAFGITGINVGKGIEISAQYTELPFSPFIQMLGSYGSVRGSTMLETTLTHKSEGWVTKAGLMYSNTQFDAGAVTRISPITSVWTEVGYEGEKFKFYAGMLPKVVAGSVDLRLPTGVDSIGNVQYNTINARVTNPTTEYIRLSYKERLRKGMYFNLHAMATTQKQTSVLGEFKINF